MSRRGRFVAALLLASALVTGGCSEAEYVAPPPSATSGDVAQAAVAADTLAAFQAAVESGAAGDAESLGADAPAGDLLAAAVANASELGLTDVTLRYVTETGRTSGTDGWDAQVTLTWRVDGFDEASARAELPMSFAAGGTRIAGIGGQGSRLPLWLAGPVDVARADGVLVAVSGASGARRYLPAARRALREVGTVVPGGGGLVVEVPANAAGLRAALDTEPGQYDTIAAVTAPVDGTRTPGSPVHVFLNTAVYDDLDPVAAQVVMTHEAVHALTGAVAAQRAPMWLIEGFADYVALRDVDLPLTRTAAQIAAQVSADGVPETLPAPGEFVPAAGHLGAVYEAAWLVCVTLAERRGEQALVGLYRDVLAGTDLAAGLRSRFGWTEAELTAAWQARLRGLPGVAG